jgi:glycine oxidase
MSPSASDVIVVGAGVIGMCTALELARAGWRVTIVERGEPGSESSWAGAGILAPLRPWRYPEAVWELCRDSLARYPALVEELRVASGIDAELLFCGARLHDPRDMARAREWHRAEGLLCADEAEGDREWLRMPWVTQIRNPRLLKALLRVLEQRGVVFRTRCAVTGLLQEGDRVQGVRAKSQDGQGSEERLLAGTVVVAAGAWSPEICAGAPRVEPVRGQMLLLRPRRRLPPGVWLLPEGYVVVRADGLCLLGATVERCGFDRAITTQARTALLAAAAPLGEALADAEILRQWAGLRPGIAGGEPIIGPDATRRGLWWNTGHFRNGLAMAPASAARLAEALQSDTKAAATSSR